MLLPHAEIKAKQSAKCIQGRVALHLPPEEVLVCWKCQNPTAIRIACSHKSDLFRMKIPLSSETTNNPFVFDETTNEPSVFDETTNEPSVFDEASSNRSVGAVLFASFSHTRSILIDCPSMNDFKCACWQNKSCVMRHLGCCRSVLMTEVNWMAH